jgi:hypothetical protein
VGAGLDEQMLVPPGPPLFEELGLDRCPDDGGDVADEEGLDHSL